MTERLRNVLIWIFYFVAIISVFIFTSYQKTSDDSHTNTDATMLDAPVSTYMDATPTDIHTDTNVSTEITTTEELTEKVTEEITTTEDTLSMINKSPNPYLMASSTDAQSVLTAHNGINYYNGHRESYYNLNMNGCIEVMKSLGYDYEYWIREDGCKMYGNYIMVAANLSIYPRGTIVETSLGLGIVVDTGGFVNNHPHGYDIAVDW